MLWVPQKGIWRVQHNTASTATAIGTSVTTGASASTKGTPAEMIASTSFDAYWVTVVATLYASSAAASQGALDILIGAATEEVLIANLLMGYCSVSGPKRWDFPLYIPAGSRLAAQAAGARLSTAMRVAVFLYGGGDPHWRVGGKVTTYGMGTVPNGTAITPGASGAEGAWTEITSSTSMAHFALVPSFQPSADTVISSLLYQLDLGTGGATEEMVAESYWFTTTTAEVCMGPYNSMPTFIDIPASTRLTMRVMNSGVNDSGYNGVIHAVS